MALFSVINEWKMAETNNLEKKKKTTKNINNKKPKITLSNND